MEEEDQNSDSDTCGTCGGSGYVRAIGPVYAGEPHMADVDEEPCPDCNEDSVSSADMDDDS